jgi:beta-glucosidase
MNKVLSQSHFPADFLWGAATASYQIEGGVEEGGRKPSVWDMHCSRNGAIWNGQSGKVACDHFHRWREDIGLMKEIGLKAYRFSVAWSRVLPDGAGVPNAEGLDFYDKLVDGLCEAGIEPALTLFHWDLPLALHLKGGWMNRDSAAWFADYAAQLSQRLSDRVKWWITFNEPQCFIGLGHVAGVHAPGLKLTNREAIEVCHNVNRAHGLAVAAIRNAAATPVRIGIAPMGLCKLPKDSSAAAIEVARRSMFQADAGFFNNSWYYDPVLLGKYPEEGVAGFGADMPDFPDSDWREIVQPMDFLGANIYGGVTVEEDGLGGYLEIREADGHPLTNIHWTVRPDALYWGPKFLHERYHLPILITENGMSSHDWVHLDGKVHDPQRIDFTTRYLRELNRAIADGVPVAGYFHWSLLDNFEWAEGFKHRFGLVHVDYPTGTRTLKDSAHWYRAVIESNGACL